MDELQQWLQRLHSYIDYLRDEKHSDEGTNQRERVVRSWIGYAIDNGLVPATFDEAIVGGFLDQQDGLAPSTRRDYASHIRMWCRWASEGADASAETGLERWFEALEGYIAWRARVGGRDGKGIAPPTRQAIRANVRSWIRQALETGLNPTEPAESALEDFLAGKNITDKSRKWRAGHIRRWWRRWPQYQASLGEVTDSARLAGLVAEFRVGGYPTKEDREHKAARAGFAEQLSSLHSLPYADREQVKRLWNRTRYDYGGSGQVPGLHRAVNDCSPSEWESIRSLIQNLCHGGGDVASQFDACVSGISGLGELVATRLLALSQPQRFIPNFILRQSPTAAKASWPGKLEMIELLVDLDLLEEEHVVAATALLDEPETYPQSGALVVRANDFLVDVLGPHFPDHEYSIDAWGIARFLYWLAERYADDDDDESSEAKNDAERLAAALASAADELLCEVGFLNEIVELLTDKGQVIFYGPPGTGKTYLARCLAWALTDLQDDEEYEEDGPYSLVQFHPAYSYEDFFEGFRPAVDDEGNMTYRLTPGPLVKLAELAEANPGQQHVMVIDEINRANLPRVLGELLYLLEYRGEWTQTQYRPVDGFTLPSNLWIIGTMNTADRSIALIDAAMRRRFHFVPFFPDREPTSGLLRRWCEEYEPEQIWVADLLDEVNQRLRVDLGGDHMLIGPSHFMKSNLNKDGVRRIWEYNIEPLIEDQFFGRREVIASYRFSEVWKRHGPGATASGSETRTPDGPAEGDESQSAGDEGAESYGDD